MRGARPPLPLPRLHDRHMNNFTFTVTLILRDVLLYLKGRLTKCVAMFMCTHNVTLSKAADNLIVQMLDQFTYF